MNEEMVDFAYYWTAVKQGFVPVLLVAAVAALLAYGVAYRSAPEYEVHFSYVVSLAQREVSAEDYRFDGYYALQATDLFAATLSSWIKAPEMVVAAYKEAGLESPDDPRSLVRSVKVDKTAPQLVQVTVKREHRAEVEALAQGLQRVVTESVERYHEEGVPELSFRVVATAPWVGIVKMSAFLVALTTFVFVMVVGINLLVLKASVTPVVKR